MRSDPSQGGLSPEEIRTTAEMAKLALEPAELERLAGELSGILAYAELLEEVDVRSAPPTAHAVPVSCPLRGDLTGPHDPIEVVLRNAPARQDGFFSVPAVFGARAGGPAATMTTADDAEEG